MNKQNLSFCSLVWIPPPPFFALLFSSFLLFWVFPYTDSTSLSSPLPFLTQILPHSFAISSHCVGGPQAAGQIFSILLWLYPVQESYDQHEN